MQPIEPFWFKQRQCRLEPAEGENLFKVSGPNLAEAFLHVTKNGEDGWKASLRQAAEGPEIAAYDGTLPDQKKAWDVAFELYRTHVIA